LYVNVETQTYEFVALNQSRRVVTIGCFRRCQWLPM